MSVVSGSLGVLLLFFSLWEDVVSWGNGGNVLSKRCNAEINEKSTGWNRTRHDGDTRLLIQNFPPISFRAISSL